MASTSSDEGRSNNYYKAGNQSGRPWGAHNLGPLRERRQELRSPACQLRPQTAPQGTPPANKLFLRTQPRLSLSTTVLSATSRQAKTLHSLSWVPGVCHATPPAHCTLHKGSVFPFLHQIAGLQDLRKPFSCTHGLQEASLHERANFCLTPRSDPSADSAKLHHQHQYVCGQGRGWSWDWTGRDKAGPLCRVARG